MGCGLSGGIRVFSETVLDNTYLQVRRHPQDRQGYASTYLHSSLCSANFVDFLAELIVIVFCDKVCSKHIYLAYGLLLTAIISRFVPTQAAKFAGVALGLRLRPR